ncbi:hypothetical protein Droror1_Dr00013708 [Drosera rotundifolia]
MVLITAFICGSNSVPHDDHHDDESDRITCKSANSSPRKTCSSSRNTSKDNKNPYSSRGLDKFSALLAEVEEKRQKVYTEHDPEEISLVRFVFSYHDSVLKPLVIKKSTAAGSSSSKSSSKKTSRNNSGPLHHDNHHQHHQLATAAASAPPAVTIGERNQTVTGDEDKAGKKSWTIDMMKQPRYYWPAIVVLILLFLALFGRSGAILCTSLGWYLLPTMTDHGISSNLKRSTQKKDYYSTKFSDKQLGAPDQGTLKRGLLKGKSV